jgi:hypothetical protein
MYVAMPTLFGRAAGAASSIIVAITGEEQRAAKTMPTEADMDGKEAALMPMMNIPRLLLT